MLQSCCDCNIFFMSVYLSISIWEVLSSVTTDTDGYLTITVEDDSFDTRGMYEFTLNGTEINLYYYN